MNEIPKQVIKNLTTNAVALPQCWPYYPYLSVIRITSNGVQSGTMVDLFRKHNIPGYSSTIFLCERSECPLSLAHLLSLDREIYDTPEEVIEAGWRPYAS